MRGPNATFQDVDLSNARVGGQVDLTSATIAGALSMNGLEVGRALFMRGPDANFRDVNLGNAKVGGQLSLIGATVAGTLTMNDLEVGQSLLMRGPGAAFQDVSLANAKVGGQLAMVGATVAGTLFMNGLEIGQSLFMQEGATFKDVDLTGAKVGGQLAMVGATVAGTLNMDSLEVGRDLFMGSATLEKRIDLIFSRIGSNLDFSSADCSGTEFAEFDLSGTRIDGELRLGSGDRPPPKWGRGARLTLRNTHVGTLQDRSDDKTDAWPTELQLAGFTYGRLGGFRSAEANMLARDIDWYIRWLARDPSYTPQPYEHLAAVFRAAGEPTKADRILYESRERARREAAWPRWLGLSLLKLTIGYGLGLRYFRALWWVGAITLLGTVVLVQSGQGPVGDAAKVLYSLDQLLPIVELANYDNVVLTGRVFYYFVAHKLIGWLLGSFLVAGLAGLTQK
jgi:uncharacterized protein YjbI with pentapeptide repeats